MDSEQEELGRESVEPQIRRRGVIFREFVSFYSSFYHRLFPDVLLHSFVYLPHAEVIDHHILLSRIEQTKRKS